MANVTSTVQSCMALAKPDLRKTPSPVVIWAGSAHPPTPQYTVLHCFKTVLYDRLGRSF